MPGLKIYIDNIQFHAGGAPVPLSNPKLLKTAKRIRKMRLTCLSENIPRGTKTVRVGDANRKPNQAEEEIHHHKKDGEAEDYRI